MEFAWKKIKEFVIFRILGLDDTPHRIAFGAAIGMLVAWTPTIPFQMMLTLMLATILRANKIVGQPVVWITNPVTAIPIYWGNFLVGCWLLPGEYSVDGFIAAMNRIIQSDGGWLTRMQLSWEASLEFFWPLWLGSVLIGALLAVLTYCVCYQGVLSYRSHRAKKAEAA